MAACRLRPGVPDSRPRFSGPDRPESEGSPSEAGPRPVGGSESPADSEFRLGVGPGEPTRCRLVQSDTRPRPATGPGPGCGSARDLLLVSGLLDTSCATQKHSWGLRVGVVSGEAIGGGDDDVAGSALGSTGGRASMV